MTAEFRAGGTDLSERVRSGVSRPAILDIGRRPDLATVDRRADGGWKIGALVTIADLARQSDYPPLAAAAAGLATPQIRRVATLGGNLLQHNRCWYYRHPDVTCLKKGGVDCPARTGNHRFHALFDLGPCVAVHPSTIGAALLTYPATLDTDQRAGLSLAEVFGDGTDGSRDHQLREGELLTAVDLPPPWPGERGGYARATSRAHAEWPLAEAVVRLGVDDEVIGSAGVAVGGVAPIPLRLPDVESALVGLRIDDAPAQSAAARKAVQGATPLPGTAYKARILVGILADALALALPPEEA